VAALRLTTPCLFSILGCASPVPPPAPPAPTQEQPGTPPGPEAGAPANAHDHPACADPSKAEKLEVARGKTERTSFELALTYGGLEHDSYEGGETDSIVILTFRGVMEDGKLTPSAFTWRPSASAEPSWVHLGSMPVCVRISKASAEAITLEAYRAPPRR
jgi:hypothetical protein